MNPAKPQSAPATSPQLSWKAAQFTESVIREMTRLALQHKAVNLSQGFPDFPAPALIKSAAQDAIAADINQYAITWGAKSLRNAIAAKFSRTNDGLEIDPEREITVCCGSTEAMISAMLVARGLDDFAAAVRALDRILLSGFYIVPLYYAPDQWIAYSSRLGRPDRTPLFGANFDAWWSRAP